MRQPARVSLLGACVLCLLLGFSALAKGNILSSGTETPTVQLIGWSPDEQRYAFRAFAYDKRVNMPDDSGTQEAEKIQQENIPLLDADGFCKGYVDHQGKRFNGKLELMVFEGEKKLWSLTIQEEPRCTLPPVATARLAEAKKKLAELGIDLSRTGKDLPLVSRKRIDVTPDKQPPYALEFVDNAKTRTEADDDGEKFRLRGSQELYLHREGGKQRIFKRQVDESYYEDEGARLEITLARVLLSPSGERAVVLGLARGGTEIDGHWATFSVATVVGWPKTDPVKEK